jgi:hypothetical protein
MVLASDDGLENLASDAYVTSLLLAESLTTLRLAEIALDKDVFCGVARDRPEGFRGASPVSLIFVLELSRDWTTEQKIVNRVYRGAMRTHICVAGRKV